MWRNFMKLREHFLCKKKKKTFVNNFFSSVSDFDKRSRQYHDACVCIPLLTNKAQEHLDSTSKRRLLRQQQYTYALCYSCECALTDTEEKNCWVKSLLLFSPLMSHGLLYWCPYCLSGSWTCELHCCLWRVRKLFSAFFLFVLFNWFALYLPCALCHFIHLFFIFLQCPHLYICIVCMYICLNCIYLYLTTTVSV